MLFYGGLALLPLLIIIFLLYLWFAARRSKADETGRTSAMRQAEHPRVSERAHGRET